MSENIFFKSKIIGVGSYLPERIVTNDDLSKNIDTDDKWISDMTGIKALAAALVATAAFAAVPNSAKKQRGLMRFSMKTA